MSGEPITGYVDRFTDENSSRQSKHFSHFSDPKAQEEPCEEANECIHGMVSAGEKEDYQPEPRCP